MAGETEKRRHFLLDGFTRTERYQSPNTRGSRRVVPARDRPSHGSLLLSQIEGLEAATHQEAPEELEDVGLQIEFESFPDIELAFESLAREASGIELLNVRRDQAANRTFATVFVPEGKLHHFEGMIRDYLGSKRDSRGRPRDNQKLVDAIKEIRKASLLALWTDPVEDLPVELGQGIWWEVWLPVRGDRAGMVSTFRDRAIGQGMLAPVGELAFPERTVLLAFGSIQQMTASILTLNTVAELRRAKETSDFFESLAPQEQQDWVDNLLARLQFPETGCDVPHICLLDTGVNRGHPLLGPALATGDLHTVTPDWGTADQFGHGTKMAGLALLGDLFEAFAGSGNSVVGHRLESVKLIPEEGSNGSDARHHGFLTIEAVSRPEVSAPSRRRVFSMAVTAKGKGERGRPSAWSSALDSLAVDVQGDGNNQRLIVVSAGNVRDPDAWATYPTSNDTDQIEDPAQSWNAITVGAYTNLVEVAEGDYSAVAPQGGLSPFSRTSLAWQRQWPLKPDVMFEGGNVARDALGLSEASSLRLLTTNHQPTAALLTTANATSAATALAARMAARVMASYPGLWPETVRGLLVHSAEWTDQMKAQFLPPNATKVDYANLVRRCGFGVPDLDHALWTVGNSLTMVVEGELTPFQRLPGKEPGLREMNLHPLPWPREALEALGAAIVEMRVTLSYFIEPNPSARGVTSRYRYESHGLRFEVKRPPESEDAFRRRINRAARDEEDGTSSSDGDPQWTLGKQARHRGSLHSDLWRGTAADLASRGILAVYPSLGWWKSRPRLKGYEKTTRYALLVSIKAPDVSVDLCTEIANQIGISITLPA